MMRVLRNESEKREARAYLDARGLSVLPTRSDRWLKRLRLSDKVLVGDPVKSWDVRATLAFFEERLGRDAPILDIGAYASEVPVALHKLGYTRIHAVDLDPGLAGMPHADAIQYKVCDFMQTPYPDASFQAVTSTSVIEHGFQPARLLAEASRLLAPGGYFIASFDYWPEKLDTGGIQMFGMDWTILSRADIEQFIGTAAGHGLVPVGDLAYEAGDALISCAGRDYTFGWLAMVKEARRA